MLAKQSRRTRRFLPMTIASALLLGLVPSPLLAVDAPEPIDLSTSRSTSGEDSSADAVASKSSGEDSSADAVASESPSEDASESPSASSDSDGDEQGDSKPGDSLGEAEETLTPVTPDLPVRESGASPESLVGVAPLSIATEGTGRYRELIDWTEWGPKDRDIHEDSDVSWSTPTQVGNDEWVSTRCEITKVVDKTPKFPVGYPAHWGEGPEGSNPVQQGSLLKSYVSGSWSGDGLSNLYNEGGTGKKNTLVNAIAVNEWDGGPEPQLRRFDATVEFDFSCGAWLISSAAKPDLEASTSTDSFVEVPLGGLVFADAESNNWYPTDSGYNGSQQEYIRVQPHDANTKWRLIDSYRNDGCTTSSVAEYLDNGTTIQFRSDGIQCATNPDTPEEVQGQGPSSVLFLEKGKSATVEVRGGGQGAVALGVMLATDYGDAPSSYGSASALFQPNWEGGSVEGFANLSEMRETSNVASIAEPTTILGESIDGEREPQYSQDAEGDDSHGADDEDGVVFSGSSTGTPTITPHRSSDGSWIYTQEVSCVGPGEVAAWVDWNLDGTFDPAEKSDQVPCQASQASLTWTVPDAAFEAIGKKGGTASTFLRARITNQKESDGKIVELSATGVTTSGEVEDYKVDVTPKRSKLVVVKKIIPTETEDGSLDGAEVASGWEISTAPGWDRPNGLFITPNQALTDEKGEVEFDVTFGKDLDSSLIEFVETQQKGYELVPVDGQNAQCSNSKTGEALNVSDIVGTASHPGFGIDVPSGQEVECVIYNKLKTYSASWEKVAGGEQSARLSGSEWTLTAVDDRGEPLSSDTLEVVDCTAEPCLASDKDPRAGMFSVMGLTPGSYLLTETKAPAGYKLLTDPILITIADSSVDIGKIENDQIEIPGLPLTGGTGSWLFMLGSTILAVLMGSAYFLQRRTTARTR